MRTQSESSLLSGARSKREKILEIDGTVTTQPVLEHVGISTWPGIVCNFSIVMVLAFVHIFTVATILFRSLNPDRPFTIF